jgi:diacylglycerol kinase (ATP)
MQKSSPSWLRARLVSFRYAWRGVKLMLRTQHNAWIHAAASLVVVAMGIGFGVARMEWCALVLAMMAVWTSEGMNTALEFLCDVASPDIHPLIEKAKDVAAGAVLISAIGSVIVGLLVFWPYLLRLVR